MSLTTLAAVKTHLGVSGTSEDVALAQFLGGVSAAIRRECGNWLYGAISAITAAAAAVVTCYGHGLESGQTVVIGGSNSTPTIDGSRVITVINGDTFSVPVLTTVAGTAGVVSLQMTEYYSGDGSNTLLLKNTPVRSVASIYEDPGAYYGDGTDAFAASTLLAAGTQYTLKRDNAGFSDVSRSGIVYRIGGLWPRPSARVAGLLSATPGLGMGNIKATYVCGYGRILPDVQLAVHQFAAECRLTSVTGGPMQSETYDYYTYNRMDPAQAVSMLTSVKSLIKSYKRWVM